MTPDISRILVPLDFSTNSRRALDYVLPLARKFDAALHLVHVCEVPSLMMASLDAYAISYNEWSESVGEAAVPKTHAVGVVPAISAAIVMLMLVLATTAFVEGLIRAWPH